MTELRVGVVDVFVVDPTPEFRVLLLRRARGVRCTGAWEGVHGSIDPGEPPEEAAVREFIEETGLQYRAVYSIGTNPFYLPRRKAVQVALIFAVVADSTSDPVLGDEHDAWAWLPLDEAVQRATWPRTGQALRDIHHLLKGGDAGPVEDVLRVR